jgi:hypothetical protein
MVLVVIVPNNGNPQPDIRCRDVTAYLLMDYGKCGRITTGDLENTKKNRYSEGFCRFIRGNNNEEG